MSCWPRRLRSLLIGVLTLAVFSGCDGTGPPDEGNTPGLPEPQVQSFPRWSPNGGRILYYDHGLVRYDPETNRSEHDQSQRGLWTMRPDGTDRRQVLAGESLYGDWSPGRDSLVFEAGGQIYTAAFAGGVVDTASIVRLSPPGRRCFFPDWSSNGKRVAYDNTNCGTAANPTPESCGIYLVTNEGTRRKRVSRGRYPGWSPDGEHLVYVGLREEIFRLDLREERQSRLTSLNQETPDAADVLYPRFSPDGEVILVEINSLVWTMDADGSNKKQLTEKGSGQEPDWSPGGERIVYIGPEQTIWVMDADGSDKMQLTTRPEGPVGREKSS